MVRSRPWRLGIPTVLGCLLLIGFADLLIWRWKAPYAIEALLDEPAHAATGLLALTALGQEFVPSVVVAVLVGSLAIDTDHVPHVLGSQVLQQGVPRPYTHSLGTIIVLLAVGLLLKGRQRKLTLVATAALALHFFRDAAEPGGPGVSLLWPASSRALTVHYPWYAGAVVGLAAIALIRRRPTAQRLEPTDTRRTWSITRLARAARQRRARGPRGGAEGA